MHIFIHIYKYPLILKTIFQCTVSELIFLAGALFSCLTFLKKQMKPGINEDSFDWLHLETVGAPENADSWASYFTD